MKKILLSVIVGVMLLASVGFVFAVKPTAFDANGNEVSWAHNDCTRIQDGTLVDSASNLISIGYDQWGYNYQAHMFNGFYDNYARPANLVTEGPWLMMKWSDEWLSNSDCNDDGKLDRGYSCDPENAGSSGCYGAWLTNHERGSYLGNWDIIGDWVLEFDYLGSLYIHDMTIVDNTFTGTGSAQFSSQTWTIEGTLNGDNIEMTIDYDGSSYYVNVVGTIASDGTMSGIWSNPSQSGTWVSSEGSATGETCQYEYFVKIVTPADDAEKVDGKWYTLDGAEIGPVIWGAFAIIQEKTNDPCGELGWEDYKSPSPVGLGFYT